MAVLVCSLYACTLQFLWSLFIYFFTQQVESVLEGYNATVFAYGATGLQPYFPRLPGLDPISLSRAFVGTSTSNV
jgi:hypothetical protein